MKPKNFPNRKQQRRQGAMERLMATDPEGYSGDANMTAIHEMQTLAQRLAESWHIITKKVRPGRRHA